MLDKQNREDSYFTIFYSYVHEDEELRDKLEKHLSLLKQEKYITSWHDRRIPLGGLPVQQVIDDQLVAAHIILLLGTINIFSNTEQIIFFSIKEEMDMYSGINLF